MEKLFALCRDALKSTSFEEALSHAETILEKYPTDIDALRIACTCNIYLNDISTAWKYAEKV